MNKRIYSVFAFILCTAVIFSSCGKTLPEESTSENISSEEISFEEIINNNNAIDKTETTSQKTVSEEESTEETQTYYGNLLGFSSKNYPITEKDGIYYIDGILVANKTYALPANYNPGTLTEECELAFSQLQAAAKAQNLSIYNASGFRSYELQESLYKRYSDRDGKEAADRYSARPGHSEHQSGLAIDLNTITSSFKDTPEGKWVAENSWKYGFILRYPEGKEAVTGYMYEPWHIRYVGYSAAKAIYESGLCFEEYYGITSFYADITESETVFEEEFSTEEITTEEILSQTQNVG